MIKSEGFYSGVSLNLISQVLKKEHEKLKTDVENKLPMIDKVDMHSQFLEERVIDLETITDKLRNNGTHD